MGLAQAHPNYNKLDAWSVLYFQVVKLIQSVTVISLSKSKKLLRNVLENSVTYFQGLSVTFKGLYGQQQTYSYYVTCFAQSEFPLPPELTTRAAVNTITKFLSLHPVTVNII